LAIRVLESEQFPAMFDFAWSEILVIGVVALVVIGPKDLPKVLRAAGKWAGKARAIAREFQGSIEQMIRESELEEMKKEVEKVAATDIGHEIEKSVDPGGELQTAIAPPELGDSSSGSAPAAATTAGEAAPAVPAPEAPTPEPVAPAAKTSTPA
jgi:sec-independent protein translocase protein TatB